MKHLLILIIMFVSCVANICTAQTDTVKQKIFSHSIRGGFNASTRWCNDKLVCRDIRWRHSFNVGITFDIRKSKKFLGRTGIYYTEKGFNDKYGGFTQLNYLEMPVLAVFQFPVGKIVKFETQAGMFFAYGVGGRERMTISDPIYDWDEDCVIYDNFKHIEIPTFKTSEWCSSTYKRFDVGLNVGFGVNVSRFYIGCSYDVTLGHQYRTSNHCGMIDLGYTF